MADKTNNPVSTDEPLQDDTRGNLQSAQELKKSITDPDWLKILEQTGQLHPVDQ